MCCLSPRLACQLWIVSSLHCSCWLGAGTRPSLWCETSRSWSWIHSSGSPDCRQGRLSLDSSMAQIRCLSDWCAFSRVPFSSQETRLVVCLLTLCLLLWNLALRRMNCWQLRPDFCLSDDFLFPLPFHSALDTFRSRLDDNFSMLLHTGPNWDFHASYTCPLSWRMATSLGSYPCRCSL